jgi:hypothetical protein
MPESASEKKMESKKKVFENFGDSESSIGAGTSHDGRAALCHVSPLSDISKEYLRVQC